jgi:hypothetical protein
MNRLAAVGSERGDRRGGTGETSRHLPTVYFRNQTAVILSPFTR